MVEQVTGAFYIAFVVARMVALTVIRRRPEAVTTEDCAAVPPHAWLGTVSVVARVAGEEAARVAWSRTLSTAPPAP